MLEGFQKKMEDIAEAYADLVLEKIKKAQVEEVLEKQTLDDINSGIRLLNHAASTLERINRIQNGKMSDTDVLCWAMSKDEDGNVRICPMNGEKEITIHGAEEADFFIKNLKDYIRTA